MCYNIIIVSLRTNMLPVDHAQCCTVGFVYLGKDSINELKNSEIDQIMFRLRRQIICESCQEILHVHQVHTVIVSLVDSTSRNAEMPIQLRSNKFNPILLNSQQL